MNAVLVVRLTTNPSPVRPVRAGRAEFWPAVAALWLVLAWVVGAGAAQAAGDDDLPRLDPKLQDSAATAMAAARQTAAQAGASASAVADAWRNAGRAAAQLYALGDMQTAFDAAAAADAASAGSRAASTLDDLRQAADAYLQAGSYAAAMSRLEREIAARRANGSPDSVALARALRAAGSIDLLQGNVGSARTKLVEASRIDGNAPASARSALLHADADSAGDLALATEHLTLAISYYQSAMQHAPSADGDVHAAIGLLNVSAHMGGSVRQSTVIPTLKAEFPTESAVQSDRKLGRRSQAEHDAIDFAIASSRVFVGDLSPARLKALVANCPALGIGSSATAFEAQLALGEALADSGKVDAAIAAVRAAQQIGIRSLGQQYLARGRASGELARLEFVKRDFAAAQNDALDAFINDAVVGADSGPLAAYHLRIMAVASEAAGKADDALIDYNDLVFAQWDLLSGHPAERRHHLAPAGNAIPAISGEEERLAYAAVAADADGDAERFALRIDPARGGVLMYTIASHTKSVIAKSIGGLLERAAQWAPTDPAVEKARRAMLVDRILLTQMELNVRALQGGVEFPYFDRVYEVRDQVSDAETQLYAALAAHGASGVPESPAPWTAVKAKLRPDEAAIEYLRIPGSAFGPAADSQFVAVVITHDSRAPAVIRLGPEKPIQTASDAAAAALHASDPAFFATPARADAPSLYALIWRPLEGVLANVRRAYVAPDGLLGQVSFAALKRDSGEYLMDGSGSRAIDIREVTSTQDLLKPDPVKNDTAVLIADPAFDAPLDQVPVEPAASTLAALASLGTTAGANVQTDSAEPSTAKHLEALPETLGQVQAIGTLLGSRGWRVQAYAGLNAGVGTVFTTHGPGVLHIATHGYFKGELPAQRERAEMLDSPLMRSLLFFAGADGSWEHHRPSFTVDANKNFIFHDTGILTAYEAAALDLRGTQLVVLSACETGAGSSAAGEGVIGMMRSLQEAGARAVLMTLWEVPTAETTELLTFFYQNWIGGDDEYAALRRAQHQLRDRMIKANGRDDPNAWAGFVLVGGY